MTPSEPTRREFVASSTGMLSAGWLWLNLPVLASLSACARDAARSAEPFVTFTPAEGRTMQAFAARILPSGDGLPGATEAGAAWFADAALAGPLAGMLPPVRAGLADLDERARGAHGGAFDELTESQQDELIAAVTESPFFTVGRMLVVMGVFSDPTHGGNRDHAGFAIVDMDHAPAYQPPFGWYDAEHARTGGTEVVADGGAA